MQPRGSMNGPTCGRAPSRCTDMCSADTLSLRWGELAALRRTDIDVDARTVKVQRTLTELAGGGYTFGPPKSPAGRRIVVIPDLILTDLTWHLGRFVAVADDALVFTSPTGK